EIAIAGIEGRGQRAIGHEHAGEQFLAELVAEKEVAVQTRTAVLKIADQPSQSLGVGRTQLSAVEVRYPTKRACKIDKWQDVESLSLPQAGQGLNRKLLGNQNGIEARVGQGCLHSPRRKTTYVDIFWP